MNIMACIFSPCFWNKHATLTGLHISVHYLYHRTCWHAADLFIYFFTSHKNKLTKHQIAVKGCTDAPCAFPNFFLTHRVYFRPIFINSLWYPQRKYTIILWERYMGNNILIAHLKEREVIYETSNYFLFVSTGTDVPSFNQKPSSLSIPSISPA